MIVFLFGIMIFGVCLEFYFFVVVVMVCLGFCFVGIMMLFFVVGKIE